MPWNKIIAMRHKLINGFSTLEKSVVWSTTTKNIPDLMNFCEKMLKSTAGLKKVPQEVENRHTTK
jgi:uncharacterized protein with HEPN domain